MLPDTEVPAEPLLMNAREVAVMLGRKERSVYRDAAAGRLPGVRRLGKLVFFSRPVLMEWLQQEPQRNGASHED